VPTGIVTFDAESLLARAASGMTLIGVSSDVLLMTSKGNGDPTAAGRWPEPAWTVAVARFPADGPTMTSALT
jgi:hypothetical protein